MSKPEEAKAQFLEGANCAQAVVHVFAETCGIDTELGLRMASGFGAGMGRMREVCGAVSGMFLVANLKYGYADIHNKELKDAHYQRIQTLGERFKAEAGSIICGELLKLPKKQPESPISESRTATYYTRRPCAEMVALATRIMETYLEENP